MDKFVIQGRFWVYKQDNFHVLPAESTKDLENVELCKNNCSLGLD